jgi:mannose-1-phosphate guanylyltransferase/mannose-6-phosphate isomerase
MTLTIQPVILAGGSGTRLWPASRQSHPKQLLALTSPHSLLQETVLRLRDFTAGSVAPRPMVITNEDYRFVVAEQLRQIGVEEPLIVLEPAGRNTAPALTLAALLAPASEDGADDDPVLLVMASDHVINDLPAFHVAIAEGAEQAEAGRLVTFGIVPNHPETGYGYIRIGESVPGAGTARVLAGFTEKPDVATALRYLARGDYLWNSGMFMMKPPSSRPGPTSAERAARQ